MSIRITDIEGLKPSFTQWDVDRVLLISGCDSQPCLRFDNPELMRSLVVEAEADGANWKCLVPNFMLQFAGPMVVSVFVQPDEGKTVFTAMYPVVPAKKPQDYTYEENIGYVNWVEKSEEAQELLDDIAALREEIQSAAETATSASEAAVAAAEDIDETVAAALQTAKESGDFDGADGQDGLDGAPGPKGDAGEDGISPRFSSTAITGGHRVTVQDAYGEYTFDVMDGADGQDGQDGQDGAPGQDGADGVGVPSSGAAGDVLRKASGTDFDTEWHSPEIFWAVYDSTTADEIETARIDGKAIMCAYGGKTYVMNYRQNATKFYFTAADRNSLYHISVSGRSWSSMSTKNVGTYSKPSGGIPASDLVSGISVPTGGTTGQVLKKASGTDYDTEWANESGGGGGTRDYSDLTNKPQIAGVTLSGNKSLADLGIAAASDIPTVPSAYTSTPADLGTASAGSSTSWAKGDHVHKMPSAADVGAVAANQGAANANKVLTVNSSGVVVPEDNRFVVTLTPTAQDFSGVMDKTVAEINAAYKAGKLVLFRILTGANSYAEARCTAVIDSGLTYPSYGGYIIDPNNNILIYAWNSWTDDGSQQVYSTTIYPLASGQWTGGSY